jgi:hypothetical protein
MSDRPSLNGVVNLAEHLLADRRVSGGGDAEPLETFVAAGSAAGGRVSVRVDGGGYISDLVIDEGWLATVDGRAVADAVTRAVADAVDHLHAHVADVLGPLGCPQEWSSVMGPTFDRIATDVSRVGGYA